MEDWTCSSITRIVTAINVKLKAKNDPIDSWLPTLWLLMSSKTPWYQIS